MTHIVLIPPEGPIERETTSDILALANAKFDGDVDVVTLPQTGLGRMVVGCIHDWGLVLQMPLNRRASALRGGPLYGPVYVAFDSEEDGSRAELPDDFLEMLEAL